MNDKLITENIPLVYHIIYHDYPSLSKDEDIIQCGMLGLVKAAKGFDENKGSFSNYARQYIHGEIKKELRKRNNDKVTISLQQLQERGGKF